MKSGPGAAARYFFWRKTKNSKKNEKSVFFINNYKPKFMIIKYFLNKWVGGE
jgi:hypothetical protein